MISYFCRTVLFLQRNEKFIYWTWQMDLLLAYGTEKKIVRSTNLCSNMKGVENLGQISLSQ